MKILLSGAILGVALFNSCRSTSSASESALESKKVNTDKFKVEWACKTFNDTSATPPQRLLIIKDASETNGYLVTLFDIEIKQNMQFFGKGAIDSGGNGSLELFEGSNMVFKRSGNQVLTSVMMSILSCEKSDNSSWDVATGSPGIIFSCGGGPDSIVTLSKASNGGFVVGTESAQQTKVSSSVYRFKTSTGNSLQVTKQGPGIYSGLFNNGTASENEGVPCVGSFSLL